VTTESEKSVEKEKTKKNPPNLLLPFINFEKPIRHLLFLGLQGQCQYFKVFQVPVTVPFRQTHLYKNLPQGPIKTALSVLAVLKTSYYYSKLKKHKRTKSDLDQSFSVSAIFPWAGSL
jgi:hypothetical protein